MVEKLVRDRIPEIIRSQGRECECRVASEEEFLHFLTMKLDEEVAEYKADRNLEELADVLEVLVALAEYHGYSEEDLLRKRHEKATSRGKFVNKYIGDF